MADACKDKWLNKAPKMDPKFGEDYSIASNIPLRTIQATKQ